MVYFYVLCIKNILMKLVGYQQPTCLCVMTEFVIGTISLSCELCSLSKAAFVHVRLAQLCTENGILIYMCSAIEVARLAQNFRHNSTRVWFRTIAKKFSIGGLYSSAGGICVCAGGLYIIKLSKIPLIYSVSRFTLGGLELCLGGLSPPQPPRCDGTGVIASAVAFRCLQWSTKRVHFFNDIHKPMLGLIGLIIAT